MHALHGSLRRSLGHCRSATLPGTTSCAATRLTEVTRFIREQGFTDRSSPGVSPGIRERDGRARPRVGPTRSPRAGRQTGDGEILMELGALATIGVQRPQNLSIAVFDSSR